MMGFYITLCTQGNRQAQGIIVFYCTHLGPTSSPHPHPHPHPRPRLRPNPSPSTSPGPCFTLKEKQKIRTFVTVSKVSGIENEWWSMGKKLFKAFLLIQERFVGNIYRKI